MTKYQQKIEKIDQKLVEVKKKVDRNSEVIGKFKVNFDNFIGNHFNTVKTDVKWLKKLQWWTLGILSSIFIALLIAILTLA
jgi:hypothetical protein